ncbi:MAG: SAM-dependent methyltransferase [Dehalococcoidia bacterium]|nr:SAM-dependent methyltransferase [Dehalococcoidia bacterium]
MRRASSARLPASFRDPSGFLFQQDGVIYRQVNLVYKDDYDHLMSSSLYQALVDDKLLIPHEEVSIEPPVPEIAYKIIKPEMIPFISYPYEWCFSQLRDAALTTLKIQRKALEFGMTLRDSSAYNIQYKSGRPIFIDTLSFGKYREGQPWVAYRQFCQHFLAPLALMSYKDIRLSQLLSIYIDGLPLDLTGCLLPWHTRLRFSLLSHIHLHARSQKHFADKPINVGQHRMSRYAFLGILNSLESTVKKLKWQPGGTEWADYYQDTNYSPQAFEHKKTIVAGFLDRVRPATVWDLGANVGIFSRLASDRGIPTVSFDVDPAAVEKNYLDCVARGDTSILPLVIDLTNPSPGIGWENKERMSLKERGPADAVLALALVHHLAISNNVPLSKIAGFLSDISHWLIIEFVPKNDSQVQRLLATREDIFPDYTRQAFEQEFSRYFTVEDSSAMMESQRTLYLMRRVQR